MEHFAISTVLRLRFNDLGDDMTTALQHAWKTTRYNHPQIAACGQGGKYVYDVPDASHLDKWLSSTFTLEQNVTPTELHAKFAPTELATLHYFPHTSEVLFRSSHYRIDGVGAVHLLNGFLAALANPRPVSFGDEGKNLSIGLDEAANTPLEDTAETEKAATELIEVFTKNTPSIGLPTMQNDLPSGTRRGELELSPETTSAVISKCKASDISVTAATHAAILCATQGLKDPRYPADKYTTFLNFDLRKYCPPPYNDASHAVSIFHTGIPITVVPSSFIENAAQFKKIYTQRPGDPGAGNMFSFLPCYVKKVHTLFATPPPPGSLPSCEPAVSSLGVIDKYFDSYGDKVQIEDFWLGVEMLTKQVMVYIWTFHGKMKLSVCYNEAFYDVEFVDRFLARIRDILIDELQVGKGL